jgi:hypothetical protein
MKKKVSYFQCESKHTLQVGVWKKPENRINQENQEKINWKNRTEKKNRLE